MNIKSKFIGDLLPFKQGVIINDERKTIELYCIPIEIVRFENGVIKGYSVEMVYEVEAHLSGEKPTSNKIRLFTANNVPDEIANYLFGNEQYKT